MFYSMSCYLAKLLPTFERRPTNKLEVAFFWYLGNINVRHFQKLTSNPYIIIVKSYLLKKPGVTRCENLGQT